MFMKYDNLDTLMVSLAAILSNKILKPSQIKRNIAHLTNIWPLSVRLLLTSSKKILKPFQKQRRTFIEYSAGFIRQGGLRSDVARGGRRKTA